MERLFSFLCLSLQKHKNRANLDERSYSSLKGQRFNMQISNGQRSLKQQLWCRLPYYPITALTARSGTRHSSAESPFQHLELSTHLNQDKRLSSNKAFKAFSALITSV